MVTKSLKLFTNFDWSEKKWNIPKFILTTLVVLIFPIICIYLSEQGILYGMGTLFIVIIYHVSVGNSIIFLMPIKKLENTRYYAKALSYKQFKPIYHGCMVGSWIFVLYFFWYLSSR